MNAAGARRVSVALLVCALALLTASSVQAVGLTKAVDAPQAGPVGKAVAEGPGDETACFAGGKPRRRSGGQAICPRLPATIAPWPLRAGKPAFSAGGGKTARTLVTNEAGDELEVSFAVPSTPYKPPFEKNCDLFIPYLSAHFNPCGYVTFYDVTWKTSVKAPETNVEENAQYDACGKPVGGGTTAGWHVIGTNYTLEGWHAGHEEEVPLANRCLGTWTLRYVWTQTFADNETLTDSIEVPFEVTDVPTEAETTWGGGNESELPCAQQCEGDPVNTASGDYNETTTDLAIPGRGPGLDLTRTYSSLAARAGMSSALGRGWSFSYGMSLVIDPESGDAAITNTNGSISRFSKGPEGFIAPPEILATLVENEDGSFTYTVKKQKIYRFATDGKLIGISDLNGNETTLSYDESGTLASAEDGIGRTLSFEWDEATGNLSKVTDASERSVGYEYDPEGNLEKVTDVRGGESAYTYNADGLMLTHTDPRENTIVTNTYDGAGRVLTQTDGLGRTTTFTYSGTVPFTSTVVEDPRGFTTKYEYVHGALAERIEAANSSDKAIWVFERDPATLGITAVTDPTGRTRHATYDARGNQTSTEDENGHTTESVYDGQNDLVEFTDADGVTTKYTYDEQGNMLTSSTPLVGSEPPKVATVTYAHGDEAHPEDVTAITDPRGKTTNFTYDAAGNLKSSEDAMVDLTTYTYDPLGRRLSETRPNGNVEGAEPTAHTTTFTYDEAGNRLSSTDPLGHERKWTFDADGNVLTTTDANSHTTTYAYDAANQRVSVERPDGQIQRTEYDADGNISARIDGLGRETSYTYTPRDQLATSTDPRGRQKEYRYYQDGKLRLEIDPQGRAIFYGYDPADQLVEVEYEGEGMTNLAFEYDPNGQRTSMIDGTGESAYEYDSLGRLTKVVDGHGDTTTYGYDLAGNVTEIGYPNGKAVVQAFDDAGRMTSTSDWLGNTVKFGYDADSNLTRKTFPIESGNVDEFEFDDADRLSGVLDSSEAEPLASLEYRRDGVGQVTSLSQKGLPGPETEAYEYDQDNRLTQAGADSFAYDDANNMIGAAGTTNSFDAANQLIQGSGTAYRYDLLGERREAGPSVAAYQSSFGESGSENGQLDHPAGIVVNSEGDLWVVDKANNRIEEFSNNGEYLSSFGGNGEGNGQFERPTDIAIDGSGHLWVTDTGNNRVQEFNQSGEYLAQFGSAGEGEGQFAEPESLAVDSEGNIWVADTYNARLEEFDPEGRFLQTVGEPGSEEGQIDEAASVAIDAEDNLWLAD